LALFGFFDYNRAGKGISKNEPEKKAFFKFWELFARKFWKILLINMLYVLFCLPVLTIGPATVALTQVMRRFTLEQPIFLFEEFWTAFKKNFRQGMIIGLFDIVFIVSAAASFIFFFWPELEILITGRTIETTLFNSIVMSLSVAAGLFIYMMHFYIYPQIAALTLSMNQIIKNALLLTILGIKGNLVTLFFSIAIIAGFILTIPYSVFFLLFAPFGWISFLAVFNAYPVIQKYIINPFYESRGEKNPEIPDYMLNEDEEEPLFEDFGGREAEIKSKPKLKGKVIK